MALERLIDEFTKEMEWDFSLATEVRGIYALPIDDFMITLRELPNGQSFAFECSLGACPKQGLEEFYQRLLLGNLFGQGTHWATLSLSDDGESITISQLIDYEVDYKEFRNLTEDFINTVDFWREESKIISEKK